MHVEGKLHTGYAKIRKVLAELKSKREEYRRQNDRQGGRRSRSRSLSPSSKARSGGPLKSDGKQEKVDDGFNYSSKRLGTGANCHETTQIRFSDYAIQMNTESSEQVVLQSIEKLGKEWGYYKRNIDKHRRELQNELKRKEEEKNRQSRYESYDRGGGAGRFDNNSFRRPSSPPRGGGGRDYRGGGQGGNDRGYGGGGRNDFRSSNNGGGNRFNSSSGDRRGQRY